MPVLQNVVLAFIREVSAGDIKRVEFTGHKDCHCSLEHDKLTTTARVVKNMAYVATEKDGNISFWCIQGAKTC